MNLSTTIRQACACVILGAAMAAPAAQASVIADWTFETSAPATAGPFAPETGAGAATGFHASGSAVYSSPAGDGSSHSFSSNYWSIGDYFQFQTSTLNLSGIALSWDQTSSNTGPQNFVLDYSTDGTNFTQFGSSYAVLANATPNTPWSSTGSVNLAYAFSNDLSGITGLNNQANVYFRLIDKNTIAANGGTVGTSGTDRVDNFTVTGTVSVVPVPGAAWLFGSALLATVGFKRRKA